MPTAARKAKWTLAQVEDHRKRDREGARRRKDAKIDRWRRARGLCGLEEWRQQQRARLREINRRMAEME